jgi:TolA-binding protein
MAESSPHTDWQKLGAKLDAHLSDDQVSAFRQHIYARRTVERRRRVLFGGTAILLLLTVLVLSNIQLSSEARDPASSRTETRMTSVERTAPSPTAEALVTGTRFTVEEGVLRRIYHVASGQVRFETREGDVKPLEVRYGELVIEDIGTVFTVETLPNDRARISVLEGRVRVTWPGSVAILAARESGVFPPEQSIMAEPEAAVKPAQGSKVSPDTDWRSLARQGEHRKALELLEQDPTVVSNRVPDLLLAADVMRLCGNFEQAASYLEKIVKQHRRNSRATLAAFTLGRVYLDELGRPEEAAMMFERAGSGKSPLAEEALAREVEAWSRAKEAKRASEAARRYLMRYPKGDRVNAVRAFGGLDER